MPGGHHDGARRGLQFAHRWMQHLLSRYSMPAAASPTICSSVFTRRRVPSVRRKVRKSPPGGEGSLKPGGRTTPQQAERSP